MSIKSELCKDFAGEDGGKFVSHRAWHRVMWKFRKKFLSLQPENVTFKFLDYERHYNIKRRNRDVPAG